MYVNYLCVKIVTRMSIGGMELVNLLVLGDEAAFKKVLDYLNLSTPKITSEDLLKQVGKFEVKKGIIDHAEIDLFENKQLAMAGAESGIGHECDSSTICARFAESSEAAYLLLREHEDNVGIIVIAAGLALNEDVEFFTHVSKMKNPPVVIWISGQSHEEVCKLNFYGVNIFNKYIPQDIDRVEIFFKEALYATIEELTRENLLNFSRVNMDRLLEHHFVNCDLFIQISPLKMVKLVNAYEKFSKEIFEKYRKKGIKYLYVHTNDYMSFTEFTYESLRKRLNRPGNSIASDISYTVESTSIIHDTIRNLKISESTVKILNEAAASSIATLKKNSNVKGMIEAMASRGGYLFSHCLMISYIGGMVSMKMEWNAVPTLQKISMAAIIHDVALDDEVLARIDELHTLDFNKIGLKNIEHIKKHPLEAKQILDKMSDLPPDVAQIVLAHHERPEGTGFPRNLNAQQVSQISSLFIIVEDFVNRIYGRPMLREELQQIASDFTKRYLQGNYRHACEGILKMINESF
ncbi:MAG: HD domain-containing protein [Oligoflexia bacterium]|nr:HD domain-containing protein [Oligoflexia bacterium]